MFQHICVKCSVCEKFFFEHGGKNKDSSMSNYSGNGHVVTLHTKLMYNLNDNIHNNFR